VRTLLTNTLLIIISFVLSCWIPALAQANTKTSVMSPDRGVITNTADLLRPADAAKVINNLQMTKRGVWTSRGIGHDRIALQDTAFNSGATILEMAIYDSVESGTLTRFIILQAGDDVFAYRPEMAEGMGNPTTESTSHSSTAVPSMKQFSDGIFLWANGDAEPRYLAGPFGTNFAALSGWPVTVSGTQYSKPKYLETFATRAVYAGFPGKPFNVLFSKANAHNTFTVSTPTVATDAGAFEIPSELGPVTGLKTFRIGNDASDQVLVVGCERGVCFISGTDATDFSYKEITREHGVVSNRAWVQVQDELFYPATDGIRSLSPAALDNGATLTQNTPSTVVQDLYAQVDEDLEDKIFAVHHPSTQEVQFWLPIEGDTVPSHVLVMNYANSQPGQVNPIWSTKDGISGTSGINFGGRFLIGTPTGWLHEYYIADDNDGSYIQWSFVPALIESDNSNPGRSSSSRRFYILTEGPAQSFTATAYGVDTSSTNTTRWTQLFQQSLSASAETVTDTSTWASGNTTTTPHIIEFDPTGSARYWGLRLHAAQSGDHINLIGVIQLQSVGGMKQ
jgi:hypothetical protein